MNQKQKETLMRLFKEQQKLNLQLFKIELELVSSHMDYKCEKSDLQTAIYNSKKNIKEIKQIGKGM